MGIYIKGMEMPECCGYCPFEYKNYCMVKPSLRVESADRHPRCPLVPVPPHGRLGDLDALVNKHFGKSYFQKVMRATKEEMDVALTNIPLVINNAPTIIEAEEVET